jgi:DNA-directed RNA polymerase subunit K/omega
VKEYTDIDSKFRFVVIASKRAKDLLKGAKPKVKSKSKNLIRIAQEEVKKGLIEFELVESTAEEEVVEQEDLVVGEELFGSPDIPDVIEKPAEPLIELKDVKLSIPKEEKKTVKKAEKKAAKKAATKAETKVEEPKATKAVAKKADDKKEEKTAEKKAEKKAEKPKAKSTKKEA